MPVCVGVLGNIKNSNKKKYKKPLNKRKSFVQLQ